MKCAVLFSGGKDSTYAAYLTKKQGYDISCLISIFSENPDSYMFHTPSISKVNKQSELMNIPLLIQKSKGKKEKELEDLKLVIQIAKKKYKIDSVVTGSVESAYQASRIQKICDCLNLDCFNPLWQKDQFELLNDLIKSEFKIIITGVFAYPLNELWLGREINKKFVKDIQSVAKSVTESTYNFIDVLEDTFHLKDIYKGMPDETERILNMDEFYGLFRDFVKNSPDSSLDEFLNELTLQSEQDQVEGESIYMMSIHASKGLEFDHIFIIGMEEGFLPLVGDGSDLEEERRLGYVSFTRAKETLTLSHVESRFYKGRRSDLQKSRFFNEAGLCEGSLIVEKNTAFKKGDLVRHKIFGTGRVTGVSKSGREFKLNINFAGTKRDILASFVERL